MSNKLATTFVLLCGFTTLTACSSFQPKPEELKAASTCEVWKEGRFGERYVTEVQGEVAKQKMTCWIMNTFACTYTDYTFRGSSNEILSSLPPADKAIGKLDGDKLSIDMTGATVEPFQLKSGVAEYKLQGPVGPKQAMKVEFNDACSKRQAALGIMTLVGR